VSAKKSFTLWLDQIRFGRQQTSHPGAIARVTRDMIERYNPRKGAQDFWRYASGAQLLKSEKSHWRVPRYRTTTLPQEKKKTWKFQFAARCKTAAEVKFY
jgi:hypothetical protein